MKVLESVENYLEAILILTEKYYRIRSVDIANYMNFSKPTVSVAMKQLRENGYIVMSQDNYIQLTGKGLEIAEQIYERHRVISAFLIDLGVDEETAYADACKIEHDISDTSFMVIKQYYAARQKGK
jgi:Mn-dependent DtxR family transcriptional regulator